MIFLEDARKALLLIFTPFKAKRFVDIRLFNPSHFLMILQNPTPNPVEKNSRVMYGLWLAVWISVSEFQAYCLRDSFARDS